MKKLTIILTLILIIFLTGCSNKQEENEIKQYVQNAFKARIDAVFLYKDKKPLNTLFSKEALEDAKETMNWHPVGTDWTNIKNAKYNYSVRLGKIEVSGKRAYCDIYETAVVSWDYIDPNKVKGVDVKKEDRWFNRLHKVTLTMSDEGKWIVDRDIVEK